MAWVSPTGHNIPDAEWWNPENTYDDDLASKAQTWCDTPAAWRDFLELTINAITCDKIRHYSRYHATYIYEIDIDVYKDGEWVHVYQGTYSHLTWEEKTFSEGSVTKARVRYKTYYTSGTQLNALHEFDFWSAIIIIEPTGIASAEAFGTPSLVYPQYISPTGIASAEAFGTPVVAGVYAIWTDWEVDAYAVALCSFGAKVFAFRIDATDGHLYRRESTDNGASWGSWTDMGDITGTSAFTLAACFKDATTAIVLYSTGTTLYRRRWDGENWEAAAAWTNSASTITGLACVYMGDWNIMVTGQDSSNNYKVWTCVYGDGYSASPGTWSSLAELTFSSAGSSVEFHCPYLTFPDVFRAFFVEKYTGTDSYSRPFWSHSLATADFISNL